MGYGLGIILIVIGAIILFVLEVDIPGVGDDGLGWILIAAGAAVMVITAIQLNARRTATTTRTTTQSDGSQVTEQQRTDRQDPPAV